MHILNVTFFFRAYQFLQQHHLVFFLLLLPVYNRRHLPINGHPLSETERTTFLFIFFCSALSATRSSSYPRYTYWMILTAVTETRDIVFIQTQVRRISGLIEGFKFGYRCEQIWISVLEGSSEVAFARTEVVFASTYLLSLE